MTIKRALLSVWNKDGIEHLANFLHEQGVEIISTGGTKSTIENNGIPVISIKSITKTNEVMGGRVKTLHPKIFGGILADRKNDIHLQDLRELDGLPIDLVIVNFYPFQKETRNNKISLKEAIEFIDIGGPSMIRAAAKNFHSVVALCNPSQYDGFIELYKINNGDIPLDKRQHYAYRVFEMTTKYDQSIYNHLSINNNDIPKTINLNLLLQEKLRYGENPHQSAGYYQLSDEKFPWIQLQGKTLSFNNYADIESAYEIVNEFEETACCIIKHSNPCGFGIAETPFTAYRRAVETDPLSCFGGIVSFNREINEQLAEELIKTFLECIIAPSITKEALNIFQKKKNLRIIKCIKVENQRSFSLKSVAKGYLYQEKDSQQNELNRLKIVTKKQPNNHITEAFTLGWKLVRHVKSNGIVFTSPTQLIGVGAGQMSRIDSVKLAIQKAGENGLSLEGAIMASDAFFPFPDGIEVASKAGIEAIIQPGGSIKDHEVIEAANKLNMCMVFTETRHFYH